MKVMYDKIVLQNPLAVLRKAGYSAFTDPKTGEESFVLRTTSEFYPRFHLYLEERGSEVTLSLHLDQRKASYGSDHAHNGEYDGKTVEDEMRRIDRWVSHEKQESQSNPANTSTSPGVTDQKTPWWKVW